MTSQDEGRHAAERSAARALLRGTSHVSWLIEADGTIRWASPTVTRTLGYAQNELVGTIIISLLHPDDRDMAAAFLAFGASNPMDGGFDRDDIDMAVDFRMRHRQGRWVTLEVMVNNFLATPGIHAHLVVGREATGRRALDDALTALAEEPAGDEALLRLLAFLEIRVSGTDAALFWPQGDRPWTTDRLPDAFLLPEGPWADERTRRDFLVIDDIDSAEARSLLPGALIAPAREHGYVACWCAPVPAPLHTGADGSFGLAPNRPDPRATLVIWSTRFREPTIGHWNVIERVAGLADFALAHRASAAEARSRLERAREQNRRLQELDAMKTERVLSISHELRTPLTSIVGLAELLSEKSGSPDADEQVRFLEIISRNATRLLGMVEDLLFLGQLESGTDEPLGPVDVAGVVKAAVGAVRPMAGDRGVTLTYVTSPGHPLLGSAERFRQLVDNLLSNAVKYTEPGGQARVDALPLPDGWQLTVSDQGIGIPEDERPFVFERFYRGSNARRSEIAGTGLGLAIAKAVVDLHRGSISVAPTPGGGTTFVVTLHDA